MRPATGSGITRSSGPATTAKPPRDRPSARTAQARLSSSAPTATMLCESWATLDAIAPARRPNPRMNPTAGGDGAYRFTTTIFSRSFEGSATARRPSSRTGTNSSPVTREPSIARIARTSEPSARIAKSPAVTTGGRNRFGASAVPTSKSAWPARATHRPSIQVSRTSKSSRPDTRMKSARSPTRRRPTGSV